MIFAQMDNNINIFGHTAKKINTTVFCSVVRFPASPAAEKKGKQWLNMTAEKKKAQQDKVAKCKKTR